MRWHKAPLGLLAILIVASPMAQPEPDPFDHLLAQCELGPRNPGSPGHRACAAYIEEVLTGAGGRVVTQRFTHTSPFLPGPVDLVNISAHFGPARSGGLLLGAHWDTRPWANLDPDSTRRDEPIIGANDGASGTALLLALAESFRRAPPPIPVELVFFDGEDMGQPEQHEGWMIGSRYYAQHRNDPPPEAALVVDMVASESMVLTLEEYSRMQFPHLARLIDEVALELGTPGYTPGSGPPVYDDHIPLIEAGIPTILIIDFRDPVWHTHADRPEHCSRENLAASYRLVHRLIFGGFFH